MTDHQETTSAFGKPPSMYQCGICKREYRRLDHLSRHSRSHTQSRPHKCHICSKSFTRTDLLKRHLAAHERHTAKAGQDAPVSSYEDRAPLGRVALACKACSSNHLRCSDQKPCRRCLSKGVECVWDATMDVELVCTPPMTDCEAGGTQQDESPLPVAAEASNPDTTTSPEHQAEDEGTEAELDGQVASSDFQESCVEQDDGIVVDPALLATSFPFRDGFPSLNLLSASWSDFGDGFGLDTSMLDDLENVQFSLASNYDAMPFETYHHHHHYHHGGVPGRYAAGSQTTAAAAIMAPSEAASGRSSDPGQPAAMCTEAFRNSHWHFRPEAKDYAGADNHNLSLAVQDSSGVGVESPESRILDSLGPAPPPPPQQRLPTLSAAARDKILTMVVRNADLARHPEALIHFPSAQLLDTLLRLYLQSPVARAGSFIHVPTFVPDDQRPELLAAMAAHGAVLTSNPTLTKIGFAIAEIARLAIARLWDNDNSLVRDLHLSQAFCIILELGLWSGHARHVEIAECFLHPLVTMMRRAGKFRAASYSQQQPRPAVADASPDARSEDTREQWLAWVEVESFKRLAFRVLQHDTNASMALLVNPIISYAEVQMPIPDSAALWSATTVGQWKTGFLSSRTSNDSNCQRFTTGDLIDDPNILNRHAQTMDRDVGCSAVLSLGWMLTWEYTRMVSFQKVQPRQFNSLITKLRLDELRKLLSSLAVGLASVKETSSSILPPRLELLHLHLHMPLEDIQTFAGMQGAHQARAVYPSVREWAQGKSARRAVYHAAQIIRASRGLPDTFIQGSEAIIIYYASLALWVYGLLVEKQKQPSSSGDNGGSMTASCENHVCLDAAEESIALQRFIEFGVGNPCIQRSNQDAQAELGHDRRLVYLDCPDAILEAIINVVRCNFQDMEMAHLTQKLIQLMEELRKAARQFINNVDEC